MTQGTTQRNSKSNQCLHLNNDSSATIIIDSSDETTESPAVVTSQQKQSWNPFPDFTPQKFKRSSRAASCPAGKFSQQLPCLKEELNGLRAQTKLTRREIDAWFYRRRSQKALKEEKVEAEEAMQVVQRRSWRNFSRRWI